ncbi:helix-turn-helix domain-containing protein [Streptococcus uberis]|uniref:helix-turn-helix domain-containing protein n=1 Tax=Streptococcus uberis TaxID=1349 RepID=UPI0021BBF1EE|nr:helix-turn-helix domain-containing protein [Streptococcus uberis]
MNENQRRQIWAMRRQGHGYGTIAQAVNLPRDAVRKFCNRRPELKGYGHVVQRMIEEQGYDYCLTCDTKLDHKLVGRPKKFCSDRCRAIWWRDTQNQHDKTKTAYDELTCQNCGRSFLSYANPTRKFCGHPCYIEHRFRKGVAYDNSTQYGD